MRIPGLPQSEKTKNKKGHSLLKRVRSKVLKKITKKRNFVRIPPRK